MSLCSPCTPLITPGDYALLGRKEKQTKAVQAYEKRHSRLRGKRAYQKETGAGMNRVDFLMGCTRWIGLEKNGAMGPNE